MLEKFVFSRDLKKIKNLMLNATELGCIYEAFVTFISDFFFNVTPRCNG